MKGTRAAHVNAHLREQLREATEARTRLERRLKESELELVDTKTELNKYKSHQSPEFTAAAMRADAAEKRARKAAAEAQLEFRNKMSQLVDLVATGIDQGDGEAFRLMPNQWEQLGELCGHEAITKIMGHKNRSRDVRRSMPKRVRSMGTMLSGGNDPASGIYG